MRKFIPVFAFLMIFMISGVSFADEKVYITDPTQLTPDQQKLYKQAYDLNQSLSEDWSNANEANRVINEFIIGQKNFLPIYIEKTRYIIMDGYVKRTKIQEVGNAALSILHDIQKKDPNYPNSYILEGHVHNFLQDYPNAKKALDKAEGLGATDTWLYINRADLLERTGQNSEAMTQALKGFQSAGDNKKALSASITLISSLRGKIKEKITTQELVDLIYKTYKDPDTRLFIASNFINSFNGSNKECFNIAAQIISNIKSTNPELKQADLAAARLILSAGFLFQKNYAKRYTPESIANARTLLTPLINEPKMTEDVYDILTELYFSEDNFIAASQLLDEADRNPLVSDNFIKTKRGISCLMEHQYELAIYFFDEVAKTDPSIKYSSAFLGAYAGMNNYSKVEEFYLREVEWNPFSAWANGNYAQHLLAFKGDYDQAIKYSTRALKIMDYPSANRTLMLALYLKWAHIFVDEKNPKKAQPYFVQAYRIMPDMTYVVNEANKSPKTESIVNALRQAGFYKE